MMRIVRAIFGKSRRMADMDAEVAEHRAEQEIAMQAVAMKVAALEAGAERIKNDSRKAKDAAWQLVSRLREDLE